jgi:hypothetical protein
LIPSARISYVTRTQTGSFSNRWQWFTYLFGLTIIYFVRANQKEVHTRAEMAV